ncbi:MAG: YceG family protein [Clostridiales bacterium]|nr:YceG family protein [Clostridiales bacterium]
MDFGDSNSFELIFGYDDVRQFKQRAESFIAGCDIQNVFIDAKISAPAYKPAESVMSFVPGGDIMRLDESVIFKIVDSVFAALPLEMRSRLTGALTKAFAALKAASLSSTQVKNAFIRTVCSLDGDFAKLLQNFNKNNRMFFEGELNKYDFATFNVLCMLGVRGMAVCLSSVKPDFLTKPLFAVTDGHYKTKLDFRAAIKSKAPAELHKNQWLNFHQYYDIDALIDTLLQSSENRLQDGYKVLSLNILGVSDQAKYESALNRFYLSLKSSRSLIVIDASFANPTFDEVKKYDSVYSSSKSIEEMLGRYVPLRGTHFPSYVKESVGALLASSSFSNESQKKNFEKTIHIWLIRICDILFSGNKRLEHIPVAIVWDGASSRVQGLLRCLDNMPVDIIQFSPGKRPGFSPETQKTIDCGPESPETADFPYELKKLAQRETVAYGAEQEIREILSTGITTFYQMKQFRELNPIVLKTTFEEIDIIWKEPAKFRPAFSTAGDIVTIPSIFAKINGVKDSVESYLAGIRAKITADTLFIDKFPYMPPCQDPAALDFVKRVYFKDHIDMEKIKNSKYYSYGLFGAETQNVIAKGIIDFLKNDWYAKKRTSFGYDILECLLRLPHDAVQLIHNFSFTESVPKVVVFNPGDTACSAEDCILIMFLKSLGFDVAVYAPTGYMVIEEHIHSELFNSINIGPYNYSLSNEDIKRKLPKAKKGLFGMFKQ